MPQLFVATGANEVGRPQAFPWTIGWQPDYQTEARIYAKYILPTKPDAKIASSIRTTTSARTTNRPEGRARLRARQHDRQGGVLREDRADHQLRRSSPLQGSGADMFIITATPKFAAQAIRKVYDLGWKPLQFLNNVSLSVPQYMKPAGLDKSKGVITAATSKTRPTRLEGRRGHAGLVRPS